MTRDNEIANAASEAMTETLMSYPMYEFSPKATDLLECAYIKGAEWADEHPKNFWHSVADGDLPTLAKGDDISLPFLIEAKDGSSCRAYYGYDEFDVLEFFDDCGCALSVDYWAEIPKLPENNK